MFVAFLVIGMNNDFMEYMEPHKTPGSNQGVKMACSNPQQINKNSQEPNKSLHFLIGQSETRQDKSVGGLSFILTFSLSH